MQHHTLPLHLFQRLDSVIITHKMSMNVLYVHLYSYLVLRYFHIAWVASWRFSTVLVNTITLEIKVNNLSSFLVLLESLIIMRKWKWFLNKESKIILIINGPTTTIPLYEGTIKVWKSTNNLQIAFKMAYTGHFCFHLS